MLRLGLIVAGLALLSVTAAARVCGRPREIQFATFRPGKVLYEPRDVVTYTCNPGYERESPGTDRGVCSTLGSWEHATLTCKRKQCPKPLPLDNGAVHGMDLTYGSMISFSCNTGYRLQGAKESACVEGRKWSTSPPVCEVVTCPPPVVPKFAQLALYSPRVGNVSNYLDVVTYQCQPNYAMFGSENATCTENGTWTAIPECRDVKCPRLTEISNGYMSFSPYRKYNYKESVVYGCNPPYALDGPRTSFCDKDGNWSQKPLCKAPCQVTTPKATVLHNGRRTRVDEISGQQIQHGDILTYFCKNKEEKCAYTVQSRCNDGNFTIPACYKKPGVFSVFSTDPSRMTPCAAESEQ
ncbi:beta-2-glycoprotein 1 [Hyperolius riggenbachi]|uniref:beta-2-glycoprotein 1 n=1 Tax=Hyperolius riggenbachi TaxID=752182 RepID=UPI0035A335D5